MNTLDCSPRSPSTFFCTSSRRGAREHRCLTSAGSVPHVPRSCFAASNHPEVSVSRGASVRKLNWLLNLTLQVGSSTSFLNLSAKISSKRGFKSSALRQHFQYSLVEKCTNLCGHVQHIKLQLTTKPKRQAINHEDVRKTCEEMQLPSVKQGTNITTTFT